MAQRVDCCAVAYSGGKDSIVTLDLCCRNFKRVHAWFWYVVKGLEFQESFLRYAENKYDIQIERIPHEMVARFKQAGVFSEVYEDIKQVSQKKYEAYLRDKFKVEWLAYGYKANDNFKRRGILFGYDRAGIEAEHKRFYPVASWSDRQVETYIKAHRLYNPKKTNKNGWGCLDLKDTWWLYKNYPEDYERVRKQYPFIEANVKRIEFGLVEVPDVSGGGHPAQPDKECSVQSEGD